MIKSHPTAELIREFVAGELSPALALAVSAHVDMCRLCQAQVLAVEAELAGAALDDVVENNDAHVVMDAGLEGMLANILESEDVVVTQPSGVKYIELNGRKFRLPRALQTHAANASQWRQMGKLWRSRMHQDESWRTSFLYIEQGGNIPQHTHKGREATLVLSGSFVDEDDIYQEGDFILRDANHTHTPGADASEDCLCFAAVEAPLHFTSGPSRLLNPLGKLLY
ncbi:ChrR family anti-sigma-E factor [Echinimonas agarilytica]|uniref:ChrR family anti-sigma-E factor n=1 Tax=Echinimonas agarilytica TaxID=1215918 RepID=A0AA41W3T7_9GAMM|nr:ChrR family anti-sigma-E factor [Echinimonas agarilytica]MCM2678317.1 ChrR family anti-sigma-E factor [Echinimonas agarilytica]